MNGPRKRPQVLSDNNFTLSSSLSDGLDEDLLRLREKIKRRAFEIANKSAEANGLPANGDNFLPISVEMRHLAEAEDEILGKRLPQYGSRAAALFEHISPFTLVSSCLCVIFALFGYWAMTDRNAPTELAKAATGFLDIAKIFAGAIVGSTAATITSRRTNAPR